MDLLADGCGGMIVECMYRASALSREGEPRALRTRHELYNLRAQRSRCVAWRGRSFHACKNSQGRIQITISVSMEWFEQDGCSWHSSVPAAAGSLTGVHERSIHITEVLTDTWS